MEPNTWGQIKINYLYVEFVGFSRVLLNRSLPQQAPRARQGVVRLSGYLSVDGIELSTTYFSARETGQWTVDSDT